MKLIGITGGVGAGKSEILQYIRKNYPQIDNETYYQLIAIIGMIRVNIMVS